MTNFEEFKDHYKNQSINTTSQGWKQVIKASKHYRKKLIVTQLVLGTTLLILLYFFFYISAQTIWEVAFALLTMIGVLALRIILEGLSMVWLKNMGYATHVQDFYVRANAYHRFRTGIQLVASPILYIIYIYGFTVLLPYFKISLSKGFYQYVLISGIVTFIILGAYISNEIRKEMKLLKIWKEDLA